MAFLGLLVAIAGVVGYANWDNHRLNKQAKGAIASINEQKEYKARTDNWKEEVLEAIRVQKNAMFEEAEEFSKTPEYHEVVLDQCARGANWC